MRNRTAARSVHAGLIWFWISLWVGCGGSGYNPGGGSPSLQSITVTPGNTSVIAGRTQQFSAVGNYSDGSNKDVTSLATWTSSDVTVATVNGAGLATTLKEGSVTITAAFESDTNSTALTATPLTVQVSVVASDSAGRALTYQWRSTDGAIQNVNAATTTWTLPDGPGLHFAYVLVSNGVGGYTERRIAVNTDTIGTPLIVPAPISFSAPAATPQSGDFFRGFLHGGALGSVFHDAFLPDFPVYYVDDTSNQQYPSVGTVKTNVRGEFIIPNVNLPPAGEFTFFCLPFGGSNFSNCGNWGNFSPLPPPMAFSEYITSYAVNSDIGGELVLADGSPCGAVNEFFDIEVVASATLVDASGKVLAGPVRADQWGDYDLPYNVAAASVVLQCENAPPVSVLVSNPNPSGTTDLGQTVLTGVAAPTVTSMTAQMNNTQVGTFLPPPSGVPSDIVPLADAFLAEKGLDSRVGACQYYQAVGAVKNCDSNGNPTGAITFEDWKSSIRIDQYAQGAPVYSATYINKVDLNLARNHHSVSYGPGQTAAYVCNHLGPSVLDPAQAEIDSVIQNTVNGQNLVACVAMDFTSTPGVNGGQPFVRFLIFGPSGQLLPSVNLDGRREKFVPGTCVVCHGGDHYAGKFPEDGTGSANVGGRFLPYDAGNFEFSSQTGLTEADQEQVIYLLNQNILNAGPTQAEQNLIAGWYANGQVLDKNYVPTSWQGQNATAISFYQNVSARSCRTCHVALADGYNFDNYQNITPGATFLYDNGDTITDVGESVCGGTHQLNRAHKMPNSLVTFNRFWLSSGTAIDQPSIVQQFLGYVSPENTTCVPGVIPHASHRAANSLTRRK